MADAEKSLRLRLSTLEMAYGPHAVARHEGKVIFIRGAAPDEEVEAVVREQRHAFAFADAVAVLRPSPWRRTPPCPYLPRCGGCPWQHLAYDAQLAAKRRIVAEHLRRIARLDAAVAPVLPSPHEFGYRRRIKLRVENGAVGYYAAQSHTLVPVDHCILAEPAVDAGIPAARTLVRALPMPLRRIELIGGATAGEKLVAAGEVEGSWRERAEPACREWLAAHAELRGLVLRGRGWRRSWGDVRVRFEPEPEVLLSAEAPAFTQVNAAANRLLVATVVAGIGLPSGRRVLDLYAGAGNLSLPLVRRGARVTAVEQDRQAADGFAAGGQGLPGQPARVIRGRSERVAERLVAAGERFDAVVLDPPRGGAAACVPALLNLAAPRLVYVACDPATLARDLAALSDRYRIETVQPIDMFPHTYHVETVVVASLAVG